MEFKEPRLVVALKALKDFRAAQAALDGDPLWGRNLAESRRLYTRACGLIDSACKHAGGDRFESFYSLRHGLISDEVLEALMMDDPEQAQAALKLASRRANHRDIRTTVENYFHLSAEVLYKLALLGLGKLLTAEIAAKWSGVGRHALEQRVSRGGMSHLDTWWTAIAEAAPLAAMRGITLDHPCAPATSMAAKSRLTLDDIANSNVCTELAFEKGRPVCGSMADMRAITATPWGEGLVIARTKYSSHWRERVRRAATRQAKLRPIARRLRAFGDTASVRMATALWRTSAKNGFLDVSDPAGLKLWVTFLRDCGVPASRLVLRVESALNSQLEVMNSVFSSVTNTLPLIEGVPGGKGRPSAYLLISSMDPRPGQALPSAATSMAGFNALMLSACIREDLIDTLTTERQDASN